MSRSIHATSREFERLVRSGAPPEELREAARVLRDKHYIKRGIGQERRLRDAAPPPTAPDAVPVRVYDQGPHVLHAASPDDVREVLRRLPPGITDGLAAVHLKLGLHEQLASMRRWPGPERPDPYTGRWSTETVRGIWDARVRGRYRPRRSVIEVYAFVVAGPDEVDVEAWLWGMRVEALTTLVHQAARHHDTVHRVARGRWRANPGEHAEAYARARAREWRRDVVLPYLFERDPPGAREHPRGAASAGAD
ncbi:MAG TPA: hypothetical protein VLK84_03300 [Longimicrobium sp.]|nr:hypothetical protein [Longimicrobium sp.]